MDGRLTLKVKKVGFMWRYKDLWQCIAMQLSAYQKQKRNLR